MWHQRQEKDSKRSSFIDWLNQNGQSVNSQLPQFDNLLDPSAFNKTKKIEMLQNKYNQKRKGIHSEINSVEQFSKSIYKKVISRENQDFQRLVSNQNGNDSTDLSDGWQLKSDNSHTTYQKKKRVKISQNNNFKFTTVYSNSNNGGLVTNATKALTISEIDLLDTPQFIQKCKNCQFYDILTVPEQYKPNLSTPYVIYESEYVQTLINNLKFKLIDQDQTLLDERAHMVPFKAERQLKFWENNFKESTEIQILGQCSDFNANNPTYQNLLDIASAYISPQQLIGYHELKKNHETTKRLNQNDENLQKKYQIVKQQLQYYKDRRLKSKDARLPIKFADNQSQTLNVLEEASFSDYFQNSIEFLQIKLNQMKGFRTRALYKEQKSLQKTVLVNINHQIRWILLEMLCYTINHKDSQANISYEELYNLQDSKEAQRLLLDFIHKNYSTILKQNVEGRPKIQIINIYLKQRDQCERYMQIIQKQWN